MARPHKSFVRPTLEYASLAWDPNQQGLKDMLEKVQRKAARKVLSKFGRRHSPTEMIHDLGWEPLEKRRENAKLLAMYEITMGQEAWNKMADLIEKAKYLGRHDHCFKIAIRRYNSNVGRFSFLGTTIPKWNCISEVLSSWPDSVESFKTRLRARDY